MMDVVNVGNDPRVLMCLWRAMERSFGARTAPGTDVRVLLAAPPRAGYRRPDSVRSRADAASFLKSEAEEWAAQFRERGVYADFGHTDNPDHDKGGGPPLVSTVGFWLLPPEAFGPLPAEEEVDLTRMRVRPFRILDLRGHPPRTGLFDLPDTSSGRQIGSFFG